MTLSILYCPQQSLIINGREYEIVLEFSRVLRWFDAWKRLEKSDYTSQLFLTVQTFTTVSLEEIPQEDIAELVSSIIEMIIGEEKTKTSTAEYDLNGNLLEEKNDKQFYDFEEDSHYIYSSFMMDYAIDLVDMVTKSSIYWYEYKHGNISLEEFRLRTLSWDKFNALLVGLSDDSKFRRVIEIRQAEIPENATPKQIDDLMRAKRAVMLSSDREEIEFEMMDLKQKREFMARKEAQENG